MRQPKNGLHLNLGVRFIMNKKQKQYLLTWLIVFALFTPFFIFSQDIIENWALIKWPSFIVLMAIFAIFKDTKSIADARNIHEYTADHPWVIIYLGIFSLSTVVFALYVVITNKQIENHGLYMFWAFSLLVGPPVIGQQLERYLELGKESNN